jgi:hypothetical protein
VTRTTVTRTTVTRARGTRTGGTSREPGTTRKPRSTRSPRGSHIPTSPRHPGSPGSSWHPRSPGHPVSPGGVAVGQPAPVGARRRAGGRRAGVRRARGRLWPRRTPPAAVERILARGVPRARLIPWSPRSTPWARRLRAVRAIGARRNPAPVRQPILAPGHRPAIRGSSLPRTSVPRTSVPRAPVHRAPVRGACGHGAGVARRAARCEAVGRVSGRRRETARRRPQARTAGLVGARPGRHFPGAPQQLAVLVVIGVVRPVRARAVVRPVGAAVTQASSPGQAIGIAAQAGVATFHQVPPGLCCPATPQDMPLPHECRSGEIPGRTWTVNCHQLHIIGWY